MNTGFGAGNGGSSDSVSSSEDDPDRRHDQIWVIGEEELLPLKWKPVERTLAGYQPGMRRAVLTIGCTDSKDWPGFNGTKLACPMLSFGVFPEG